MGFDRPIQELARAIRRGDLSAANAVLDGMHGRWAEQVSMGRAEGDRDLRRDPPLPELVEPHVIGFAPRSYACGPRDYAA